jgi:hypothetical protein
MNLHRITLLAAFVASLSTAYSATTVASAPYGAMSADLPVGTAGAAFPLIAQDVFAGRLASNTAATVTFESGNLGALLTAGDKYYVEIVSGPLEGERFDLNTASTISSANATATLDLAASSHSTSNTLAVDALAQARAVVRPHVTLAKIGAMFTPALVGSADNNLADGVRIYGGPAGIASYYLRSDGSWRTTPAAADQRNMVVPPDVSVILVVRSGPKQWTHLGAVRTNAFRKKLKMGVQAFATGFPIDLSPVQISAFVDPLDDVAVRWTGSDTQSSADTLRVYDPAMQNYKIHYLRADGTSWYESGGSTNVASTPFLKTPAMLLVSRVKADPAYLIIRPYSL